LLSLFIVIFLTPFWIFLYLIIRPSKSLFEKNHTEVDWNLDLLDSIIKDRVWCTTKIICPKCNYDKLEESFKFCPKCDYELKITCRNCKKELNKEWHNCPYCWKNQEKKK